MSTPPKVEDGKKQLSIHCLFKAARPPPSPISAKLENPPQRVCLAKAVEPPTAFKSPTPKPPPTRVAPVTAKATAAPPAKTGPPKTGLPAAKVALPPPRPEPSVSQNLRDADPPTETVPHVEEADAAGGGGAEPEPTPFSLDKGLYNKFNYRIRGAGPEIRAKWDELQKGKNPVEIGHFIDVIVSHKKGGLPEDFLHSYKSVEDETINGEEGGWYPWKEISEKEGHEALLEMVAAGTVVTRRNPRLPEFSQIVYPYNQQVAYSQEKWSKKRKTTEGDRLQGDYTDADDQAAFQAKLTAAKLTIPTTGGSRLGNNNDGNAQGLGIHPNTQPSERDKLTIQQLRKTHSAWDRAKREYQGLVQKSKGCKNTNGCAFEVALQEAMVEGAEVDAKLMAYETQYLGGTPFTEDNVAKLKELSNELVENIIKVNNKKAAALKICFKV